MIRSSPLRLSRNTLFRSWRMWRASIGSIGDRNSEHPALKAQKPPILVISDTGITHRARRSTVGCVRRLVATPALRGVFTLLAPSPATPLSTLFGARPLASSVNHYSSPSLMRGGYSQRSINECSSQSKRSRQVRGLH